MKLFYLTLSALIAFTHGVPKPRTVTPYQWKVMEYGFNNNFDKRHAEQSGNLEPTHGMLIDVQPNYYDKNRLRTFVTTPRFQGGVPYSLATISKEMGTNGPLLEPYPNYEIHDNKNGTNCDAITSAFRVAITECNQMWVIDSGLVGSDVQCPPQLLLFDLNTDQIIHRYRFKASLYIPGASLLATPVVDVRDPPPRGSCKRTMVYVADVNNHGLVVYDYMQDDAWRLQTLHMYPDPNYGKQTLAGENFILMDGIFGLATDKENLYFHPFSSVTEYAVPLNVLNNSTLIQQSGRNLYKLFNVLGQRKSECTVSAMDSRHNLYCVTLNPVALLKWNVNTPLSKDNIRRIPIKPEELEFVGGMKVVKNHLGKEELWMTSNKYQKMAAGTRNFDEINFRIVVLPLAQNRRT